MRIITPALVTVLIASLTASVNAKQPPTKKQTDLGQQVEANNRFALELYQKLAKEKGDLFISPYSISSALAMTAAGARGNTANEMNETMRFVLPEDRLHAAFAELTKSLNTAGSKGAFDLTVANALWGQEGYPFLESFTKLVKDNYGAGMNQVDFANETEAARKTINEWVENQTKDKIKDLIKPGILDRLTTLVLTNAIYFKGQWASEFDKKDTMDEPFTLLDGSKRDVPMMHQTNSFKYGEFDDVKVLEMGYRGNRLSMVIVLPEDHQVLSKLERRLTGKNVNLWLSKMVQRKVDVTLPKFKMTREFRLDKTLQTMGMKDAFESGKADFSGMDGRKELFISAVIHKAFVDVNEEGTEAAAATAVVMSRAMVMPQPNPQFRADHPFVFMIRDVETQSILFIGRLVDPKPAAVK